MTGSMGLVLGGGGITGIAWELGLIAGLAERDVDLSTADLVVGTSAGSVVGAQLLSGTSIEDLYQAQLDGPPREIRTPMRLGAIVRFVIAAAWPGDERHGRARIGRAALRARTIAEPDFRRVFERMPGMGEWPARTLLVAAVEALSGEPRVFDRSSGVPIVDAVAASCAVPLVFPPMTVGGKRYVDGGARSIANADLATGCQRVVVLAPIAFGIRRSQRISYQLGLLGAGVRSIVVTADSAARKAFGRDALDPGRRVAAARAGRDQAARVVDAVRAVWSTQG